MELLQSVHHVIQQHLQHQMAAHMACIQVGQSWVDEHEEIAEVSYTQCVTCHGGDYKGSVLSKTFNVRAFNIEETTKTYKRGNIVGCYDCHNGPSGEEY